MCSNKTGQQYPFDIVFHDEYLLVLNKTKKILVHPSSKGEKHTLTSLLEKKIRAAVFPCHRLDRETTGLIIYAKDVKVQGHIMNQFRQRIVEKKYIAFIKNSLRTRQGILEDYVLDKEGARFGEKAKKAKTHYKILKVYDDFSIVQLKPLTGRTNQLRIQLANRGVPILGERKYAFGRDFKIKFRRLALHAYFLGFIHPVSGDKLRLEVSLPKDMADFLNKFGPLKTIKLNLK
jgi:23S rRNA pseudouridine1911/1915/1917 synthase